MYVCLSDDYGCGHSPLTYMGMLLMQVHMRIWVSAILFQLELEQNGSPRSARIVRTLVSSGMEQGVRRRRKPAFRLSVTG